MKTIKLTLLSIFIMVLLVSPITVLGFTSFIEDFVNGSEWTLLPGGTAITWNASPPSGWLPSWGNCGLRSASGGARYRVNATFDYTNYQDAGIMFKVTQVDQWTDTPDIRVYVLSSSNLLNAGYEAAISNTSVGSIIYRLGISRNGSVKVQSAPVTLTTNDIYWLFVSQTKSPSSAKRTVYAELSKWNGSSWNLVTDLTYIDTLGNIARYYTGFWVKGYFSHPYNTYLDTFEAFCSN